MTSFSFSRWNWITTKLTGRLAFSLLLLSGLSAILRAQAQPASPDMPQTCYLFSYFINNGDDGLHLAWSRDGLKWEALNGGKSYLAPTVGDKIIRDPCLLLGPDGVFRMVWSDSWHARTIGYASSKDLLTWSQQDALPVMDAEPTARNCWAPEVHYDAANQQYLIFWATSIPGKFPETANSAEDGLNHRFYLTTTKDFVSYTPAKLFYDPGFCCIDATILAAENKFYLIFKNETLKPAPQKNLWMASSDAMAGPYGELTGPLKTVPPAWIEGPTAIKINDKYIIYYDCYTQGHFGAIRSFDLKNWSDITPELSLPPGIRHGTVLEVPGDVVAKLIVAEKSK